MPVSVSTISALVGRFINDVIHEQANEEAPILTDEEVLPHRNVPDKIGVVNIKAGELQSTALIAGGDTLPVGSEVTPTQGTYLPIVVFSRLSIDRATAKLASSGEDGIEYVREQMLSTAENLNRVLARSVFLKTLGTVASAVTANSSTTVEVADPSGWRVGMAFAVYNGSSHVEGDTAGTLLRVTNVSIPAAGGNATITFTGTGTGNAASASWSVGYTFYLRGAKTNGMTSFSDITAAASLYSVSNTAYEWSGNLDSTTTTLSTPALDALSTLHRRRRRKKFDVSICNGVNESRYIQQLEGQVRFMSGKMDSRGLSAEYNGRPIFVDENCPDGTWIMLNKGDVKLHVFQDFAPEFDGTTTGKKGMNRGAVLVSDTTYTYDVQVSGLFNLRCERRNGVSSFSALAA